MQTTLACLLLLASWPFQSEGRQASSLIKATLVQLITFSWLNPLFAVGFKKPLEQEEIPDVDIKDSARFLSHSFDESLKQVREKDGTTNPSIYKAIFLFIRKKVAINALFAVVSAVACCVGPYLINDFVHFLTEKSTKSLEAGYLLALAFLVANVVETIAQRQWIFGVRQLGLHLKAALISPIYEKGLLLSSPSRQNHTIGEIINYMSVDIQRITDFIWYLNIIWMFPVQMSLAIYILHTNLGLGSFAALATTLIVMVCNIPITRVQNRYQSKIMEAKDNRMKATSEVLQNMKTIKLQAWDSEFLQRLESLRTIEYGWIWKSLRLSAHSSFIFWGSTAFISVVTFGACMLMGVELTAGRVLSALATFRMLHRPIEDQPDLLIVIAQAEVSADRITTYLQEDEIQKDAIEYIPKDQTEFDIEIDGGRFSWDPESRNPTLEGIQLKVKRGMEVAICGTVGSGKSSLLLCVLGDIEKLSGTVKISGTKAYVPQSAWILSGNIRENILFGNQYESAKYNKTVKACALTKDFEIFPCAYQDADIYLLNDPFSAVDAHTGTQLFEECRMGILKDKTILFVTHQVEFLPAADLILVSMTSRLLLLFNHALDSIPSIENSSRTSQSLIADDESNTDSTSNAELLRTPHDAEHNLSFEITEKGGKLVQDEEREKGSIGKEVYWSYLTIVKRGALVPFILLAHLSDQVLQVASNYWMVKASPPTSETKPKLAMNFILLVYVVLALGSSLCVYVRAILVKAGIWTSQKLFTNMLHGIFRAPMAFFDSSPFGRILNQQYYIRTARELARLAGIQQAPILHHFAESLSGATTIRAFDQEDRFINGNVGLVNNHSRPWFHSVSAMEWFSFRLNLLSNFVFAFSLFLLVTLPEEIINPSIAGLAVTYGMNLNVLQASVIWNICDAENMMISVERILQYSNITSEAPLVIEESKPPNNWPEVGTICFKNLQIRYAEHLPSVLKNINCTFLGRKKVGVVGRTGSGKSTLIQAIFRIVEPKEGSIIIDDVDLKIKA
uniref:ABC-type xenobiotic transporter n=1 Tax=Quercus lobata TaxID=97700 RepID=A0A7N2LEH7_QUELO